MPSEAFNSAADAVKALPSKPSDAEMLEIYALFKQATVGDVNTARPGMMDFKGKAKWDAWEAQKGKDTATAEAAYIALVATLQGKYT